MAETLVALLLLLLLMQLTASVAARLRRAAGALDDDAEGLEAERTTWWVLREELATGRGGVDRSVPAGDSVSLRAFRGAALACPGGGGDGVVRVRYRGLRRPEPDKDSVLALLPGGAWRPLPLMAVEGAASCPLSPGAWELWRLGAPVPGVVLLRVYERGSYHLAAGALRYRRGGGGRQPLTPARLDPGGSALTSRGDGVDVRVVAAPRDPSRAPVTWRRTLRPWTSGGG